MLLEDGSSPKYIIGGGAMVTYENLFMFISMLTSVISVVVLVLKQKK